MPWLGSRADCSIRMLKPEKVIRAYHRYMAKWPLGTVPQKNHCLKTWITVGSVHITTSASPGCVMTKRWSAKEEDFWKLALLTKTAIMGLGADLWVIGRTRLYVCHLLKLGANVKVTMTANQGTFAGRRSLTMVKYAWKSIQHQMEHKLFGIVKSILLLPVKQYIGTACIARVE
jgi:hypothetical protein